MIPLGLYHSRKLVCSYIHWRPFIRDKAYNVSTANGKGLDTPGRLAAILYKGDNFCGFLFAFLHTNPLLKLGLLKILSF